MRTQSVFAVALALSLVANANTASALNIIAFDFTAEVTTVTDPGGILGGEIAVGQILTGTFQYDLDLADDNPSDDTFGGYAFGPYPNSQIISGNGVFSNTASDGFYATVIDSASFDLFDIEASSISISPLTLGPIPGLESEILLQDQDGTALTSDALPTSFDNLSDFEDPSFYISNQDNPQGSSIVFIGSTIISITTNQDDLEGDFDGDDDVDGDDFLAWQGGFGTTTGAMKSDGDYDNDGDVDGDDFLGWQSEFGSGGASGRSAVPEPSALLLVLLLGAAYCVGRR